MAGFSSQPDPDQNLKQILSEAFRTSIQYLQIRTQLFALEAKEAAAALNQRLIFLATGGTFVFIGYALLLVCAIRWLAEKLETAWEIIGLCVAAGHLVVGIILLFIAKGLARTPVFEATLSELEKEREWLTENTGSRPKRPNWPRS